MVGIERGRSECEREFAVIAQPVLASQFNFRETFGGEAFDGIAIKLDDGSDHMITLSIVDPRRFRHRRYAPFHVEAACLSTERGGPTITFETSANPEGIAGTSP